MTEIMAPAGSFESLQAAIKAGADSIYFGIEQLNMRAKSANNFTTKDLKKIVSICKKNKVKTYLALNTIMYDHDLVLMKKICNTAKEAKVSAVILSDIAALQYATEIGLEVHMSTQTNITNIEAVKFYSKFSDVIVLARELTLKQIKHICNTIKKENITGPKGELIKIEIFVHGALCVAISGKCYMSLHTYNSSANRGACLQNCRRSYKVIDEETGDELVLDNKYVMSPKDLCTIAYIDKILSAGVSVLKIEGRGRSSDYVYTTVKVYKEAIESYINKTYTKNKIKKWIKELETVFNRGFWHGGYYLGKKSGEWSNSYGSKATVKKEFIGTVLNYYKKKKIAYISIETGEINLNDNVLITGQTTGVVKFKVKKLINEKNKVDTVKKGESFTTPVKEIVRENDKVYVLKNAKNNPL